MNKFFASIAVAASAFALASCSNDEPIVDGGANGESEGKMYTTLTLSLPQSGRATTIDPDDNTNSSDGYEVGLDPENQVGSILVVLAKKDDNGNYEYLTSNRGEAHKVSTTDNRPTYNMQFETRKLIDMVTGITDPAQLPSVYVFAFCNPTSQLIEAAEGGFADGFVDAQGKITDASISINNNFLMANAEIAAKQLPSEKAMNETHHTPDKPFFLGTVKVSRVTARFDFKQTRSDGGVYNKYPIYDYNVSDVDENGNVQNSKVVMGYVTLTHMALMNEALEYYYLPRVSDSDKWTNPDICGAETPSTFVVSPWYAEKHAPSLSLDFITKNYRSSVKEGTDVEFWTSDGAVFENLEYDAFADLTVEDNKDNSTWGTGMQLEQKNGYYIWKYVTENTIPGVNDQRRGITTGVVFKGYIEAASATSELGQVIAAAENPLYMYGGKLYGDLAMVKKFVLDENNASSMLTEDFLLAYGIEETEEKTIKEQVEAIPDNSDVLSGKNGFTVYRPSEGKYPVYYPYYNRHWDNANNTQMGAMEFATVRNNIYKLSINSILEFGHPGKPGDDPDPEDPNDPDETPKTYFRVQVKVLPWVVRVNNIDL